MQALGRTVGSGGETETVLFGLSLILPWLSRAYDDRGHSRPASVLPSSLPLLIMGPRPRRWSQV